LKQREANAALSLRLSMKLSSMLGTSSESRWRVPAILFLFTLFFYWGVLFTNRFMFPWDASDFFYPYLAFIHEELRHFHIPLWDSYVMSGFPIIGDPEAQIFYPPNWLMVLLHPFSPLPYKLVEAMEVGHFFLAGQFMYWLVKDFTKDDLSALLGGVLFMSSGAMVAHTEHYASIEAMAWYPLVFLLARRGLLQRKIFWTVCAGFFMGMENLVGHLQHAVYLGMLLFLYFVYEACAGPERRHLWPHWVYHLAAIAAIGAALAMIQIIPAAYLGPQSIRSALTYGDVTVGNEPGFLWTLFLPNIFGGLEGAPYTGNGDPSFNYVFITVPGCILALVGLIALARRRNFFWLGLILLSIELSLGRFGFLGTLVYRTPVLNLFRQMQVYFDLGNFALCFVAAIGAAALLNEDSRKVYRRWVPAALITLLFVSAGLGLHYQLAGRIHGWYHMLVVLALSAVLFGAWLRGWFRPRIAATAMLILIGFELCHYSMNQWFNQEANNPRTNLAYDYASHRKQSLEFLRTDRETDFRVAAFDGSPWGSNGCNVWRLPGIFGWNPVMLSNYQDAIRQFIRTDDSARPFLGPDHVIESPLLDLFGVKYLLVIGPVEEQLRLAESKKFERVFAEPDWRTIYRNKDFLARVWYYPQAYVLPDRAAALALMNSHWFETRRTLLFAAPDLPSGGLPRIEPLEAITFPADKVSAASAGRAENDPDCAAARPDYRYWEGTGNWIRFDIDRVADPGRYSLLAEYVSAGSVPPTLTTQVSQDGRQQSSGPLTLPRTGAWNCRSTRSTELGEFDLTAGAAKIAITHHTDQAVDFFALRLVRLPPGASDEPAPQAASLWSAQSSAAGAAANPAAKTPDDTPSVEAREFSFRDFSVADNDYAFTAYLRRDGFVLLNEIYYPGWEATVDGKPADILPADYTLRALSVPAGSHRIELRFRPRHFLLGVAVSLLTLSMYLAYAARCRRRNRHKSDPLAAELSGNVSPD
jgi:hypothetical protein